MRRLLLLLAFLPALAAASDSVWLEYAPGGVVARAIVSGSKCPQITIDGAASPMRVRAEASKDYPLSCEADVPAGAKSASIGKHELPVAKVGTSTRIAILGDTGCRRKIDKDDESVELQDCNDPKKWPFSTVAGSIAKWNPDLVLHVGDYYYREAKCNDGKCVDASYTFHRWDDDFFRPAAALLPNAPWVFVRGNHEECKRAAEGWFRYLDSRRFSWESETQCKSDLEFTPPWTATAGALRFLVLDSANLDDTNLNEAQVTRFGGQLATLAGAPAGSWLVLHHPFWAVRKKEAVTPTLWAAWKNAGEKAPPVALAVSGHIHLLETLGFVDATLPQVVAGNGATMLAKKPKQGSGVNVGGRTVTDFYVDDHFGWIAATKGPNGWTFEIMTPKGKTRATCSVTASTIDCRE